MSRAAMAWLLEECPHRDNRGWVLGALCWDGSDDGFAWPARAKLVRLTRLSESTVWRTVGELVEAGELRIVTAADADAPREWLRLAPNRRPNCYLLIGYARSTQRASLTACAQAPVDTGDKRARGVALGSRERPPGVALGVHASPPDQHRSRATVEQPMTVERASRSASVEKSGHPDCPTCHGKGEHYNAVGGFDVACPCTYEPEWKPPGPATRPPVGFGMPATRGTS